MSQQRRRKDESPVVRISLEAGDCRDTGIGIIVSVRPLVVLVPSHVIDLCDQGSTDTIFINGVPHTDHGLI
jgi:hypothetical protein